MAIVITRLFIRLSFLFVIVFSIFYFYVLWYKVNLNTYSPVKTAWIYSFKVFSDKNYIVFWGKKLFLMDNKVVLYSLLKGSCNDIVFSKNYQKYVCFDWWHFNRVVYIDPSYVKTELVSPNKYFFQLRLDKSGNFFDNYSFEWNNIKFVYKKNWDLLYKDSFWYKKLLNKKGINFVWYDEKWLVYVDNGRLYELIIKN